MLQNLYLKLILSESKMSNLEGGMFLLVWLGSIILIWVGFIEYGHN